MEEKQEKYNQQFIESKSNKHIDNKENVGGNSGFDQYVKDGQNESKNYKKLASTIESPGYSPLKSPIIDLNQDEILSNDQESKDQEHDLDISQMEQSQIRGISQRIKDSRVRMMTNIKDENTTSNTIKSPDINLEMNKVEKLYKDQK